MGRALPQATEAEADDQNPFSKLDGLSSTAATAPKSPAQLQPSTLPATPEVPPDDNYVSPLCGSLSRTTILPLPLPLSIVKVITVFIASPLLASLPRSKFHRIPLSRCLPHTKRRCSPGRQVPDTAHKRSALPSALDTQSVKPAVAEN
jgi:hypothetical protein